MQTLNQIRHLVFTAPEPIRARFLGRYQKTLVNELAALRPRKSSQDPISYVTLTTLRDLARRILALDEEIKRIRKVVQGLVTETAPSMLELSGLGPEGAATLLIAAGDNPGRIKSEAA